MAKIVLDGVRKVFGSDVIAVDDVSLDIGDGEFMVLVGPSGCGKSTILRIIAGLDEVTDGRGRHRRHAGDRPAPEGTRRRDGLPELRALPAYDRRARTSGSASAPEDAEGRAEAARGRGREGPGLDTLLERKPAALSGGQRQRVAMGRAMVREPRAFLMDEPLSNLDAKLRVQMRAELARLHDRLGTTTVYVTHDQVEAMTLGRRVAVLKDGVLQQVDTPQSLYTRPANLFVAAFIGSPPMNLVEAHVEGGTVSFAGFTLPLAGHDPLAVRGTNVILGIRPSDMEDTAVWQNDELPTIEVTAEVTEELGSEVNVIFTIDAPPVLTEDTIKAASDEGEPTTCRCSRMRSRGRFCARVDARTDCKPGRDITLSVDPRSVPLLRPGDGCVDRSGSRGHGRRLTRAASALEQDRRRDDGHPRRVRRRPVLDGRDALLVASEPGASRGADPRMGDGRRVRRRPAVRHPRGLPPYRHGDGMATGRGGGQRRRSRVRVHRGPLRQGRHRCRDRIHGRSHRRRALGDRRRAALGRGGSGPGADRHRDRAGLTRTEPGDRRT